MNKNNVIGIVILALVVLATGTFSVSQFRFSTSSQVAQVVSTDIISTDRRIDWKPGIPGGIPNYPIGVNVKNYGAVGDGVTDDWQAITNAIAAAPNNTAVYIPAGTYKLSKALVIKYPQSIVLRGDGPILTKLISYNTDSSSFGAIVISSGSTYGQRYNFIDSVSKGSTRVALNNVSGFKIGDTVIIQQNNDPTSILGSIPDSSTPYQGQLDTITAIDSTANTVTLDRPLYHDYNITYAPTMKDNWTQTTGSGVEDLYVEMKGSVDNNIFLNLATRSWVKNVESFNSNYGNISLNYCLECEIRDSYAHRHLNYDSNTRYSIQLAGFTTDTLVENNIADAGNGLITIQNGASGNVIGYNYSLRTYGLGYPTNPYMGFGVSFHGGNPNMNLVEGNITTSVDADNYWGSSVNNTVFRNYITRYALTNEDNVVASQGLFAARVDALQYNYNFVGNVLTRPSDAGLYDTCSRAVWFTGRDNSRLLGSNTHGSPCFSVDDPKVEQTILRHGNFDYASGTIQWDPNITNHNLPASFYLSAKPNWWGSVVWPAIGPDVSGYTNKTPSELCYEKTISIGVHFDAKYCYYGAALTTSSSPSPSPSPTPTTSPTPTPTPAPAGDTTAPTITITQPLNGETWTTGRLTITANATDNVAIAGVTFYINNQQLGSEITTSPYRINWRATVGTWTITAKARDTSNNVKLSAPVSVTIIQSTKAKR